MSHMTSTLGTKLLISAHEDSAVIASNEDLAIQFKLPGSSEVEQKFCPLDSGAFWPNLRTALHLHNINNS